MCSLFCVTWCRFCKHFTYKIVISLKRMVGKNMGNKKGNNRVGAFFFLRVIVVNVVR